MQITTTSIISLLIWGNGTIILLCGLCSIPKIFNTMNLGFVITSLTLTFVRFLLPLEFMSFTITVPIKKMFPQMINFIRKKSIHIADYTLYVYEVLLFLWISIAIILLFKFIYEYIGFRNGLGRVLKNKKRLEIYDGLELEIPEKLHIYIVESITTPVIIGVIKPIILLPDLTLSTQEIKLIVAHELQHYKFNDALLKICLKIFCIIYWWNPCIYILKTHLLFLLEIRADSQVYQQLDKSGRVEYLECLAKMCKYQNKGFEFGLRFGKLRTDYSVVRRAEYLIGNVNRKCSYLVFALIVLIFLSSLVLIFEPYYVTPAVEVDTFSLSDENYIIKTEKGTYELYYGNQYMSEVNDPSTEGIDGLPIYEYDRNGRVIRK